MKRKLLVLILSVLYVDLAVSQCVSTCSNYAVSPITYTTFPAGTTNLAPTFTNSFLGPSTDDGSTGPIPIGFNFNFYCNTYTNVHICTNGFIMLDYMPFPWPTQYVHPTQTFPDPTLPNGMIAFDMTDMDLTNSGSITYTTIGSSPNQMFIVTFSNVPCFSTPADLNNGQIVLYETSNIIEIYNGSARADINQGLLGATQGIENTTGTLGATPPGRNGNSSWGISSDNTAYQFAPFSPTPPQTVTGNTNVCSGTIGSYSTTLQTGASTYSWTFPFGWNGSSTTTVISPTVGSSGLISVTASYTCGVSAPTTLSVNVLQSPIISIASTVPQPVCSGRSFTISPAGGATYTLDPGGMISTGDFVLNAGGINTFTLTGSDANCAGANNVIASIMINPSPTISVNSGSVCDGAQFIINPTGVGADSYGVTGGFFSVSPGVGTYTYEVIGNSSNGCTSDPVICSLTVNANPSVTLTSARSTICSGESEKLIASGATSYSWNTGATTSSITVSPTAAAIQYTVTGSTPQGCSKSKTINIFVSACTAIEALNAESSKVSIFPNPTSGTFNVQLTNAGSNTSIEIYDATGRLIFTQKTDKNDNALNLSDQPKGLYYLRIKNSGVTETLKIVKD